ncbi:MAG: NAD-dependent epimerase/dehydratase family protein [Actinomycetaceae bacterium]|nr:NAD-dependent epimerase/dehydratase family protein [Actinomycetaceae bacterium]
MENWLESNDPDLSGIDVDVSEPVLVTGASGYVAGWIVKGLLDAGCTVHACVRDPNDAIKTAHLTAMADAAPGRLRLFATDLLDEGSYAAAMEGCGVVIHTASPFTRNVTDPRRQLIDPALRGTRNVLASVEATLSVRRVVVTSSVAAMYTDNVECARSTGGTLSEEAWNRTASPDYEPYAYAKTLAEKAAWDACELQREPRRWRLVSINPALVVGPYAGGAPTSDSFAIMRMLIDGTARFGVPRVGIGLVDVRDVARAHIAAAFLPGARGRYLICGRDTDMATVGKVLGPRYGATFPLPKRALPKPLLRIVGPAFGLSRRYVAGNVNHAFRSTARRSREELKMVYRPYRVSLEDMVSQMAPSVLVEA